ncbi:MAG TPA: guanylate kinase [Chitinivibrionales bacterium]|nr:guanylate kinase [Chitinivibrionales bacterium]
MMTSFGKSNISKKSGKIFVFSAASGAGKTTLINYLRETIPNLVYSISATTRAPRNGEKNGVHYFFLSEAEFKQGISKGEFAEWAVVHGHYYGTPRKFIDETVLSGKNIVMDIDVVGKKKFDVLYPHAVGIFIIPPSMKVLRQRLVDRKTDSEKTITVRIENAIKEIEFAKKEGKYEYIVINDDIEKTKSEITEIVKKEISSL